MSGRPIQPKDCLGFGKLTENQLMPVVQMVKQRGLLNQEPPACEGRGIVIAGGGRYLIHAWGVCNHLRNLGWEEGIQVWYLGPEEMPEEAKPKFHALGVELVDAYEIRKKIPARNLGGWELKTYACMNCQWRHVMFLDADAVTDVNPAEIFNDKDVRKAGSLFMADVGFHHPSDWGWTFCGLPKPELEWETGFFVVDKVKAWMGLRWAQWFFDHSETWFKLFHGDKGAIQAAFLISGVPHIFNTDARWEPEFGIGHYYRGKRIVSHMMRSKRGESPWPEDFKQSMDEWSGEHVSSSVLSESQQ